jgi:hypothetical protein
LYGIWNDIIGTVFGGSRWKCFGGFFLLYFVKVPKKPND